MTVVTENSLGKANEPTDDYVEVVTPTSQSTDAHRQRHKQATETRKGNKNKQKLSQTVINLSDKVLTKDETEVLELGLTFCPSAKNFSKEKLTEDFFWFFRKLKLREYFEQKKCQESIDGASEVRTTHVSQGEDQCDLKWQEKNPSWFSDKVKNNRTTALNRFMESILKDTRDSWNSVHQKIIIT